MKHFFIHIILGTLIATVISGCGYQLRGTNQSHATHIPHTYKQLQLQIDDAKTAFAFKPLLTERLELTGFQVVNTNSNNTIHVGNMNVRRYELVGVLTEVRLVLSADVSYKLNNNTQTHTLQVERSYQFNEAGVATIDQQSNQVQHWLQQALAERISEQYYALTKNTH